MAHEWDVLPHIMEIKERLASIETNMVEQKEDLKEHSKKSLEMQKEVKVIRSEIDEAKGSLSMMKWLIPTATALIVAVIKYLQYF